MAFGWWTCEFGVFNHLFGNIAVPATEPNKCVMQYYGYGYGNDLPFWSFYVVPALFTQIELLPMTCFGKSASSYNSSDAGGNSSSA